MQRAAVFSDSTALVKQLGAKALRLALTARAMSDIYEEHATLTKKYVHATSRGHEAIQLAVGLQLSAKDYVSPYYRDDSLLLGLGMTPYELMLQVFAKRDDPFSGGRTYYSHPSLRRDDLPKIPHQSSATGMQAIPAAGVAMGIQYREQMGLASTQEQGAISVCSIGDAAMTEGEISEALQMAALKQFPLVVVVQDNEWDISAHAREVRANDAFWYARGFKGLQTAQVDGTDISACLETVAEVFNACRTNRKPWLIHAKVPLLGHHTSGVRREFYRDDLDEHQQRDPLPKMEQWALQHELLSEPELEELRSETRREVEAAFNDAKNAAEPRTDQVQHHIFAPAPNVVEDLNLREDSKKGKTLMVDCALFAVQEILEKHPEALLYGQDVGGRLGGVFREAATLAQKFGDNRVFNTPIMEAFIIGSTVGMSATGCKPIVEVQFADYIWPGLNQLFTEVSRSCYLSEGKWPVSCVIRVPTGAYGSGGPYHSSSVESVLAQIRGVKVVYPSNGADLKGLLKSAFYDNNPVVILEHKGLYWSKIAGTEDARVVEPHPDYRVPIGKARIAQKVADDALSQRSTAVVFTYGMGVYWTKTASSSFPGQIEIVDLRTIHPLDEEMVIERAKLHGRCVVVTEEPALYSYAQALCGLIQEKCFTYLDAPIRVVGSLETPAIPLNSSLEETVIPNAQKVKEVLGEVLTF